ncbi:MAG: aromatic amino acid exporter YddG [Rhizobiaceae bacterium]
MRGATFVGFLAVAMWALLALLTDSTGDIPAFQLTAMTFAIAALCGMASWLFRAGAWRGLSVSFTAWLVGVGGLFGYHFVYFTALENAPAVDASLIAYLWPLFIVLGSAFMPGERLRWHHVVGAMLGLAGAAMIVTKGGSVSFEAQYGFGYIMAFACALLWSGYSLLSRRLSKVPTDAVTGFCAVTALLALLCHFIFEQTVWPADTSQWLAVLLLGLLPVGAAFFAWDYGVKRGNIQILGAASYASPLLSTIVLVLAGRTELTLYIALACLLITFGAVLASKDMIFGKAGA